MTLEGEYYTRSRVMQTVPTRRNPHDIGRRILRKRKRTNCKPNFVAILMTLEGEYYSEGFALYRQENVGRNPHDIGRRILLATNNVSSVGVCVAILMTLEGEYYHYTNRQRTQ